MTSNGLKTSPEDRDPADVPDQRTSDSIWGDHLRFESSGRGDLKQAKHYHNAVRNPLFRSIPLDQVRIN